MPEPCASFTEIYQLRVVLRGVSPLVWRRLLVGSDTSLAELHEILQRAFAWSDDHLHRFLIHGAAYGVPRLSGIAFREDARRVPLSRFRLHRGERFRYEYDFTADWQLDLRLERALPFDPKRALPSCTGGSRAAPPEGCADAWAYLQRLDEHKSHLPLEELGLMAEALPGVVKVSLRPLCIRQLREQIFHPPDIRRESLWILFCKAFVNLQRLGVFLARLLHPALVAIKNPQIVERPSHVRLISPLIDHR